MLTELSDAADIIAVSITGRLEKADVERIMQRLDAAFERGGKVHIFAEVTKFEGMPIEAWISDIGQGVRYLGHLGQFGRVAIVSDQSWIRVASRIESALLPFVSYEVFTPDQRDHALAWVKGEAASPRPEALHITSEGGLVAFEVNGRITRESIDALLDRVGAASRAEGSLRLLGRINRYDGFDPAILVDPNTLELKLSLLRQLSRYAIVGGPDWVARIVGLAAPLLTLKLRHFDADKEAEARAWLDEKAA